MRVIYDIGANDGQDISYYLLKCDLVVAVEANPDLTKIIQARFASAIRKGRLVVESCVVTAGDEEEVDFYVCDENHVLSQFLQPSKEQESRFRRIRLPSKNITTIIEKYGSPFYLKCDIEGYDHILLASIFSKKIYPSYISAESHTIEVFAALVALGSYKAFKLVDGQTVHHVYESRMIETTDGAIEHNFPFHSSGPFGKEIDGPWLGANALFGALAARGLGWVDIHASNVDFPSSDTH